jgi:hypothetical protein
VEQENCSDAHYKNKLSMRVGKKRKTTRGNGKHLNMVLIKDFVRDLIAEKVTF